MVCFLSRSIELAPHSFKQLCVYLKAVSGWMHGKTPPMRIPVYFCCLATLIFDPVVLVNGFSNSADWGSDGLCFSAMQEKPSGLPRHYASVGNRFSLQLSTLPVIWLSSLLIFPPYLQKMLCLHLSYVFFLPGDLCLIQVCRFTNWEVRVRFQSIPWICD